MSGGCAPSTCNSPICRRFQMTPAKRLAEGATQVMAVKGIQGQNPENQSLARREGLDIPSAVVCTYGANKNYGRQKFWETTPISP